jgi:hypothetical protein
VSVFDSPSANKPAPPRSPRNVDCVDGDPSCDADQARNARCVFPIRLCVNSTAVAECTPQRTDALTIEHSVDNGDPLFDTQFQALQQRANLLGFPGNTTLDDCTLDSSISVNLKAPRSGVGPWLKRGKRLRLRAQGSATGRGTIDFDRMVFTCRPEGTGLYDPRDLYTGTFDRIRQQVFAQRCAVPACHDSNSQQGNLILLPNAAYSQLVGVTPNNPAAAADGLERITPGDPATSFLYRKITFDLLPGYGSGMPLIGPALAPELVEMIRLWIIGDALLGPAPEDGWVPGTDG